MAETNPHKVNQYTELDPRQLQMWKLYVSPKSNTFGNAYQSALEAGYEESTAKQITGFDWFKDKQRRVNLLPKAEKVLEAHLDLPVQHLQDGRIDPALEAVKQKAATFVADRLGKDDGYSTKQEIDHTTQGEKLQSNLPPEVTEVLRQATEKLKENLSK